MSFTRARDSAREGRIVVRMRLAALTATLLIALSAILAWPGRLGPANLGLTEWRGATSQFVVTSMRKLLMFEERWEKALGLHPSIEIEIPEPAPVVVDRPDPKIDVPIQQVCLKLAEAAAESELPLGFFARLIWFESSFRQRLVSRAGAQGMAQFMPKVAEERGLEDPFDPLTALPASARFLRDHYRYFGNWGLAAAAYNAGTRRVEEWIARRGPMPDETRNYVRNITGHEPERWLEQEPVEMRVHLPKLAPCEGIGGLSRQEEARTIPVFLTATITKVIEEAKAAAERARIARAAAAKARLARVAKARLAKAESKPAKAEPKVEVSASSKPATKFTVASSAAAAPGTTAVASRAAPAKSATPSTPSATKTTAAKPAVPAKPAAAKLAAKPAPAAKATKPVKLAEAKR